MNVEQAKCRKGLQARGIAYRAISGHLMRNAGLTRASAATGAVTLKQRFVSALNLNVHFHLFVLAGVYHRTGDGRLVFVPLPAPISARRDRARTSIRPLIRPIRNLGSAINLRPSAAEH